MKTPRTKLRRMPSRGTHDREAVAAILDATPVCHLGVVGEDGWPQVTPTLHARVGDDVYVHGSAASRTLRRAEATPVCLTATLLDGFVLARSAMHHSVNYRAAMLFGAARRVDEGAEKLAALEALVEKLVPGRWPDVRPPTAKELRATAVLRVGLAEASAKIRSGPPVDDEPDYALPAWAGVVPLHTVAAPPVADPRLAPGIECPAYVAELVRAVGHAGEAA